MSFFGCEREYLVRCFKQIALVGSVVFVIGPAVCAQVTSADLLEARPEEPVVNAGVGEPNLDRGLFDSPSREALSALGEIHEALAQLRQTGAPGPLDQVSKAGPQVQADSDSLPMGSEEISTALQVEDEVTAHKEASTVKAVDLDNKALTKSDSKEDSTPKFWSQMTALEKARYYQEQGRFLLAERTFFETAEGASDESSLKAALLELAGFYHSAGQSLRAIRVMRSCFQQFPETARDAQNLYHLAEFYQSAGLSDYAIGLFYQVINRVVVGGPDALDKYLTVARMAKFEIARTHYESGDYKKAFEDFERIDMLQLSRENHETILYYKILAALKSAQPIVGQSLIRSFQEEFPNSEFLPELSYLRAEVLMAQGEVEAASDLLIGILENFEALVSDESDLDSDEVLFWKQKAGNRLANRYYTEGDFTVALRIYQGLVGLSESPEWQLPVIYQMSLCFEKLGMYDRAKDSLTYLIEDLEALGSEGQNRLLEQLKSNASWRLKVVDWKEKAESEAANLLNQSADST